MTAEVKLSEKDVFRFLFYHTYFYAAGWMYMAVGVLGLIVVIMDFVNGKIGNGFLMAGFLLLYVTMIPLLLWRRARKLVQDADMFKRTTYYVFGEEGMQVSQSEKGSAFVRIDQLNKIVKFRKTYFLYIDKSRANIIPATDLSVSEEEADAYFRSRMPKNRLKGIR